MQVNPKSKSIAYALEKIEWIEGSIEEIEKYALERDGVDSDSARSIIAELNNIRVALCLKQGVKRHPKFASKAKTQSEMKANDIELICNETSSGGKWLGAARSWLQNNVNMADAISWNSTKNVSVPFCKFEDFARTVAISAIEEYKSKLDIQKRN